MAEAAPQDQAAPPVEHAATDVQGEPSETFAQRLAALLPPDERAQIEATSHLASTCVAEVLTGAAHWDGCRDLFITEETATTLAAVAVGLVFPEAALIAAAVSASHLPDAPGTSASSTHPRTSP